jgi:hypothetical protein
VGLKGGSKFMEKTIPSFMQQDHEELAELLQELYRELDEGEVVRSYQLLDLFWVRLAVHIRAENVCLFPAILNAPLDRFGSTNDLPTIDRARATVARLREDHNLFMNKLTTAIKITREVLEAGGEIDVAGKLELVRENVVAVAEVLEEHNSVEEKEVYKWPRALLTESELARLESAVRMEIGNLPPRVADAK